MNDLQNDTIHEVEAVLGSSFMAGTMRRSVAVRTDNSYFETPQTASVKTSSSVVKSFSSKDDSTRNQSVSSTRDGGRGRTSRSNDTASNKRAYSPHSTDVTEVAKKRRKCKQCGNNSDHCKGAMPILGGSDNCQYKCTLCNLGPSLCECPHPRFPASIKASTATKQQNRPSPEMEIKRVAHPRTVQVLKPIKVRQSPTHGGCGRGSNVRRGEWAGGAHNGRLKCPRCKKGPVLCKCKTDDDKAAPMSLDDDTDENCPPSSSCGSSDDSNDSDVIVLKRKTSTGRGQRKERTCRGCRKGFDECNGGKGGVVGGAHNCRFKCVVCDNGPYLCTCAKYTPHEIVVKPKRKPRHCRSCGNGTSECRGGIGGTTGGAHNCQFKCLVCDNGPLRCTCTKGRGAKKLADGNEDHVLVTTKPPPRCGRGRKGESSIVNGTNPCELKCEVCDKLSLPCTCQQELTRANPPSTPLSDSTTFFQSSKPRKCHGCGNGVGECNGAKSGRKGGIERCQHKCLLCHEGPLLCTCN